MPEPMPKSQMESLLHEYRRMILRLATLFHRRYRGLELDDLISEGQIAVIVAFPGYRGLQNARLSTYLFQSIYYHLRNYTNRECRFEAHSIGDATQLEAIAAGGEAQYDLVDRVERLLDRLPVRWQQLMCAYYGLREQTPQTFREIAAEWGISPQRVEQLHRRALMRLRQSS